MLVLHREEAVRNFPIEQKWFLDHSMTTDYPGIEESEMYWEFSNSGVAQQFLVPAENTTWQICNGIR